jgi:hypothetical protein
MCPLRARKSLLESAILHLDVEALPMTSQTRRLHVCGSIIWRCICRRRTAAIIGISPARRRCRASVILGYIFRYDLATWVFNRTRALACQLRTLISDR